jgi:hypothetical protein
VPNHDDPEAVRSNGQPQPWDPAKVKAAVANARQLVLALGADESGDAYRRALDDVLERALSGAVGEQQTADRLAYLIYGSSLLAVGRLTVLTELTTTSQERALELVDHALDTWLRAAGR